MAAGGLAISVRGNTRGQVVIAPIAEECINNEIAAKMVLPVETVENYQVVNRTPHTSGPSLFQSSTGSHGTRPQGFRFWVNVCR